MSTAKLVAVVEDEAAIRDNYLAGLRRQGYRVAGFGNRKDALASFASRFPDLVIIDESLGVEVEGGFDLCRELRAQSAQLPIIFLSADPVATGLAESLARPGANATGVSVASPELAAKRLDLLHQLVPQARRIAFLLNPSNAAIALTSAEAQKAASTLGLRLEKFDARNAAEIDASLRAIQRSAPDAILVASDLTLLKDSARIASGVRKARVPAVFPWKEYHEHGVLMSYGPDFRQVTRRLASYVDRILKGANPGDLPVEEVSKFDLVVDLRVARELKIDVPQSLLLRADEVIR